MLYKSNSGWKGPQEISKLLLKVGSTLGSDQSAQDLIQLLTKTPRPGPHQYCVWGLFVPVFVEFCRVLFVIFLWLILFLNGGASVYALNFSCFYKHLLIDLCALYFANTPDEIHSLLSEFFISSQNYGLWPEMWA